MENIINFHNNKTKINPRFSTYKPRFIPSAFNQFNQSSILSACLIDLYI